MMDVHYTKNFQTTACKLELSKNRVWSINDETQVTCSKCLKAMSRGK